LQKKTKRLNVVKEEEEGNEEDIKEEM